MQAGGAVALAEDVLPPPPPPEEAVVVIPDSVEDKATGARRKVKNPALSRAAAELLAKAVMACRKKTGRMPPGATSAQFLPSVFAVLEKADPDLFMATGEQAKAFAAGRFDDKAAAARAKRARDELADFGGQLPVVMRAIIDLSCEGALKGAELEMAARMLAAQVRHVRRMAKRVGTPAGGAGVDVARLLEKLTQTVGGKWTMRKSVLRGLIDLPPNARKARNAMFLIFPWGGDKAGKDKALQTVISWNRPMTVVWSNARWTVVGDKTDPGKDKHVAALRAKIASVLERSGPASRPASTTRPAPKPPLAGPLNVHVLADGKVLLNGQVVKDVAALRGLLAGANVGKDVSVVIHPNRGVRWQRVVDVFSVFHNAGFRKVGFAR